MTQHWGEKNSGSKTNSERDGGVGKRLKQEMFPHPGDKWTWIRTGGTLSHGKSTSSAQNEVKMGRKMRGKKEFLQICFLHKARAKPSWNSCVPQRRRSNSHRASSNRAQREGRDPADKNSSDISDDPHK